MSFETLANNTFFGYNNYSYSDHARIVALDSFCHKHNIIYIVKNGCSKCKKEKQFDADYACILKEDGWV